MKKYFLILTAALLCLACEENNQPVEPREESDSIVFEGSKTIEADVAGDNVKLVFTASEPWQAICSADWISLTPASGFNGRCEALLGVKANNGYEARAAYVAFTCGSAKDTVRVTQTARDLLSIDPDHFTVGKEGGVYVANIQANVQYVMNVPAEAEEWLKVTEMGSKSVDEKSVQVTVSENRDVHARSAKIRLTSGDRTAGLTISQSGEEPVLSGTVSDVKAAASGKDFSVSVTTNLEIAADVPSWITASRTDEGFDFKVSANNGDKSRSGSVRIYNAEFKKELSFNVTQKSLNSLYILAIGNSFSVDAMQYLYQILQELGYRDIYLGNLYIGGCTLQTHAGNVTNNSRAYTYYVNKTGSWTNTANFAPLNAMKEMDWDYVSMQQASGFSGVADSYEPYLSTVVESVKANCPDAKRMWHMTWAYQGNSTHSDFGKYGNDQMTMYNAILNAVRTKVLSRGDFDFVIPSGTVVQNLRTSFIGDNITRDGYHMSYDIGRFATALMWARQITGKSIEGVAYRPSGYSYSDKTVLAIKEAVENAYRKPFEVTESEYPPVPVVSGDAEAIIAAYGYDPANYTGIDVGLTHNGFYNSTSGTPSAITTNASNSNQFAATKIFTKSDIPAGSLIVLKSGFQYRPEGWVSLSTMNSGNRPGNVTSQLVEVDSAWWGSWNYRAFNVAKAGNPPLDAAGQAELDNAFFIYVPKK